MARDATGEVETGPLRLQFDRSIKLAFCGSSISSDGGLLLHRELDDALGLTDMAAALIGDPRTGKNGRHRLAGLLRQSVFSRLAVRLQLHALAYNLANFLRTLATPETIERWSLTSLRERLIKTGTRLVRHGRYAVFQMAAAALPREVFAGILGLINTLRGPPATAVSA